MAITTVTADTTYVNISGGQVGTIDEVTTALGNSAIMEKIGSTHTIKGNRGLRVLGVNTKVTLSENQTLDILKTANGYALRVEGSDEFEMEEGSTLICSSPSAAAAVGGYIYVYGKFTATGTSSNRAKIMKHRYFRIFNTQTTSASNGEVHLEYLDLKNYRYHWNASIEIFGVGPTVYRSSHTFKDITITNDTSDGGVLNYSYGIGLFSGDFSNCTFENIVVEKNYYGVYARGGSAKFKNCTFRDLYSNVVSGDGAAVLPKTYSQYYDDTSGTCSQGYLVFDGCTFDNNRTAGAAANRYSFYTTGNQFVKLINCEFKNGQYGIYSVANSRFFVNNSTFTNISSYHYIVSSASARCINFSWELNLHIYDSKGTPIPGVSVIVNQSENKENFMFLSNDDGAVLDYYGDSPVFTEKQMYSNTPLYYNWSQSGDNYHDVIISKPGYLLERRKIYFTENKTINIYLRPETGVRTISQS